MTRRGFLTYLGVGPRLWPPGFFDALQGGTNSEGGLLWVNHEYANPLWVSDYDDPGNATSTWPYDGDNVPEPSVVAITGLA